ncbi:ATP-binding protein [Paenibacillus abyssi]|uniref:ATP-binding protein n=1 Tax=Paenibacillus abyssi TaxID=1340531 RepID=UPI001E284831|nr:ATP-binding protein [Paenibacillus abyssi]
MRTDSVLSLLCDSAGGIIRIIRDDIRFADGVQGRTGVYAVLDELNAMKFRDFLTELYEKQAIFNWEINLRTGDVMKTFYFNGGLFENNALIVASDYSFGHAYFYDEMMKINNQQMVSLRETIKKLSQEMVLKLEQELKTYDEFSSLNNELVSLQRQLAKTNIDLKLAKEKAESADRTKSMFLATMSHEIRTPMHGIIATAELLAHSGLSDTQRKSLGIIMDSGHLLLNVINDILDLSKIEAEEMKLSRVRFRLQETIDHAKGMLRSRAETQQTRMTCYIDPQLAEEYYGDPTRLGQILINLIGNAVKFTYKGDIDLRVFKLSGGGDKQRLRFEVKDTGIGISRENSEKLFMPFFQVDNSLTNQFHSTGLGLSISKRLVAMMDGSIGVISKEGAGSTFWFEIDLDFATEPLHTVNPVSTGIQERRRPEGRERSSTILLAEDNEVVRNILILQLQKLGYEQVITAANGEETLKLWKEEKPDIILMDNQMPVLNGFDATRRIREMERERGMAVYTPIISVTANAMKGDKELSLDAGMDDYITKPVLLDKLREVLDKWLAISDFTAAGREEGNEAESGMLNRKTIEDIVALPWDEQDRELLKQLIGMYRQDMPGKLCLLKEAVEAADYNQMGQIAHAIKSASVSVGLSALGQLLAGFEQHARAQDMIICGALLDEIEGLFKESCEAFDRMIEQTQ